MYKTVTVAIVVTVFNRPEEIYHFIGQILSQTHQDFRLVVVDHGTVTGDYSRFDDPRLHILSGSQSLWWSGATNIGIKYVLREIPQTNFVLLINPDVQITADYLEAIVEIGTRNPNSLIGSTCVDSKTNKVLYAGFCLNRLKAEFIREYSNLSINQIDVDLIPSDILTGRGTLVPIQVFKDIGLFSEKTLPHYGADNEFTYRAKRAGYPLLTSSKCIVRTRFNVPILGQSTKCRFILNGLFGPNTPGNIPVLLVLSFSYFKPPYNIYYFAINVLRKALSISKKTLEL